MSPPASPPAVSSAEQGVALDVLDAEYRLLMSALSTAWSASLVRTTIFLGVLSATGVALGFAAQGGVDTTAFRVLALVVLPLVLFLGIATFIRLVQIQRESLVYITGMNRIRGFFAEVAPATRPYYVLPLYDDEHAIYRSPGTGMNRQAPRFRLLYLAVQTQGIVGVVTSAVAAAVAWLAVATAVGDGLAWLGSALAFVVSLGGLLLYWQRSMADLTSSLRPLRPTPADEVGAPF